MNQPKEQEETNEKTLTKNHIATIDDIIMLKEQLQLKKEEIDSSIDGLAKNLGIKKAILARRINDIIQEQKKGGIIVEKNADTEFVETYFNVKDNAE